MILDYLGILITALLGGARLKQFLSGNLWAVPLFAHALIASLLLVMHKRTGRRSPLLQRITAWVSALLPFAVQIESELPLILRIISMLGVVIAIWTLLSLGRAFDIVPADRGLVQKGPYNYVRHPLYASEFLSVAAVVAVEPSIHNLSVCALLIATLILRIRWEERIITDYQMYSSQVNSRFIPGVW